MRIADFKKIHSFIKSNRRILIMNKLYFLLLLFFGRLIGVFKKIRFSGQKDTTVNGTNLRVFLDDELIAGEDSCSISFTHDPRGANTKDSGRWDANAEGGLSCEISSDGLDIVPGSQGAKKTFRDLLTAFTSVTAVTLTFGINDDGDTDLAYDHYQGSFRITSLEKTGDHRDTVQVSASFSSTGEVTPIDGLS